LSVELVNPARTPVRLFSVGTACPTPPWIVNNTGFSFSDNADPPKPFIESCPPQRGTFRPEQPLMLGGQPPGGDWYLRVTNNGPDTGYLDSWALSITMCPSCPSPTPTNTPTTPPTNTPTPTPVGLI